MPDNNLRNEIHRLIDAADESQLDAALELLKPAASRYTNEEIESFYKRAEGYKQSENKTYTLQESRDFIRQRFKDGL